MNRSRLMAGPSRVSSTQIKSSVETRAYRSDIDGLRAIAVLSVLLDHVGFDLPGGFLGVDIFFVISGYLIIGHIVSNVQQGKFAYFGFLLKRIRRLLPALLVTVILTIVAFSLVMPPPDFSQLAQSATSAVLALSNVYYYLKVGYFDTEAVTKPLLHTWSLSVEWQFYVVAPVVILVLMRLVGAGVWIGISLLAVASVVAAQIVVPIDSSMAYYLTPFRVSELAFGGVAAALQARIRLSDRTSSALVALGLVLVVLSFFVISEHDGTPGFVILLPCAGAMAILIAGDPPFARRTLGLAPAVFIGRISYSLYLVHWPIFVMWTYLTVHHWSSLERLALIGASILVASVLYRLVENPFRAPRGEGRARVRSNARFLAANAALACLVVAVGAAEQANVGRDWLGVAPAAAYANLAETAPAEGPYDYVAGDGTRVRLTRTALEDPKARVLLVGDSHAHYYHFGLAAALKRQGVALDTLRSSACFPVLTVIHTTGASFTDAQRQSCLKLRKALRSIAADGRYDGIILTGRVNPFFADAATDDSGLEAWPLSPIEDGGAATAGGAGGDLDQAALFARGLDETLDVLAAHGTQVLVLGQSPAPGRPPGRCEHMMGWSADLGNQRCAELSHDRKLARGAKAEAIYAAAALAHDDVAYVPVFEIFCSEVACREFTDEGQPLFMDSNHLTVLGSLWMADHLAERVDWRAFVQRLTGSD